MPPKKINKKPAKTSKPAKAAKSSKPAKSAKASKSAKSSKASKPAKSSKAARSAKASKPVKSVQAKPAKGAKAAPAESAKTSKPLTAPKAPKASNTPPPGDVDAFVSELQHPLESEINTLRKIMLDADGRIAEGIKWNAPSYQLDDHFATFSLRKQDAIQIIFHTGAKVKPKAKPMVIDDPSELLQWLANDRAVVTLSNMKDVKAKQAPLTAIVKQWISAL